MAYSPSHYALDPVAHSIATSAAPPLLPQHQPSIYSPGYLSHPSNNLPPPPSAYSSANPASSSYFVTPSSSVGLSLGPASAAPASARHTIIAQSNQPSSSLSSSSDQYYASRSASGSSSHRPRRSTDSLGFRRLIRGSIDLRPVLNQVPSERRLDPIHGGYISPLKALTTHLASTYRLINPNFRYELSLNPRRVLTKPSKPAGNNGLDNEDSDYILYVNDVLGGASSAGESSSGDSTQPQSGRISAGHKYLILDVLGQGTFGQVVKCQDMKTHEVVAVKVVKNKQAYFSQSMMEVTILELLNNTWDPDNKHHILRMKDTFIHHNHLCLVFELLSSNLYELIKQNSFRGLSTSLVRVFTNQLLDALTVLNEARLIHCDLKPENILLNSLSSPEIKVIDFGSACHERQTVYSYIQSRFYRSPEVILGLPYSSAIDMWSLGCICVELFLGLPLFPGTSEFNQITRIVEMLGMPPTYMLEVGKQTTQFFDVIQDDFNGGRKVYKLKSLEAYSKEHNVNEQPSKRYFPQDKLEDIISQYPVMRKGMKPADLEKEKQNRIAFIDFVKGLLNLNPLERWSPQQARMHPFILGEPLREPYVPLRPGYSTSSANLGGKLADLGAKMQPSSSGHAPMDTQPSSHQHPSNGNMANSGPVGLNESSVKRPYGGLPVAPARSGQKVYDAAAYSQLQAQQQAINAQAAALRQHQAQAAQQSQNPYALPHELNRSNVSQQQPLQSSSHQQAQQSTGHHLQHQYSTNRSQVANNLQQQHHHQLPQQISSSSNPISMQQAYYGSRGSLASGPLAAGSVPNSHISLMPHSQMMYNPHLGPVSSSGAVVGGGTGRHRSGTMDQMDLVPPQLQKVQNELANYAGGHSVTPVLRRDDQYLAWEQRQQQAQSQALAGGMGPSSGLHRRASYRGNPQLDYLLDQAESNEGWNANRTSSNSSTYYTPLPHHRSKPSPPDTFAVVVDGGGRKDASEVMVALDTYDHRDGGQAMAYLPMIPKPLTNSSRHHQQHQHPSQHQQQHPQHQQHQHQPQQQPQGGMSLSRLVSGGGIGGPGQGRQSQVQGQGQVQEGNNNNVHRGSLMTNSGDHLLLSIGTGTSASGIHHPRSS